MSRFVCIQRTLVNLNKMTFVRLQEAQIIIRYDRLGTGEREEKITFDSRENAVKQFKQLLEHVCTNSHQHKDFSD